MARAAGVAKKLVLPVPPAQYSAEDQRQLRNALQQMAQQPPSYNATNDIPAPVTALGGVTGATDTVPYFTSATVMAVTALTAFMRTVFAAATAAAARTTLGAVLARSNVTKTTASLANLASESGNVATPASVQALLTVAVDHAAWVRLYATASNQSADSTRTRGTLPTAGKGVLAEFDFTTLGAATINCSPVPVLANDDGPPVSQIYYTIVNTSGAPTTITLTMNVVPSIL